MPVERRSDKPPGRRGKRHGDADEFWADIGVDVEQMSPRAQAISGVVVGGTVLLAAALLILFTDLWWLIFIFGWALFPALGIFARGVAGLAEARDEPSPVDLRERELLDALRSHGELTPARAAMETSLTVAEAEGMLKELAEGGHLDVRVRGGGLFYALWEPGGGDAGRGAERELEGRG